MKNILIVVLFIISSCDKVNTKPLIKEVNKKLNGEWEVINFTPVYDDFDLSMLPQKVAINFHTLNNEDISADLTVEENFYKNIKLSNTFHGSKKYAGVNFNFPERKTDYKKYLFSIEPYSAVFYPNEDVVLEGISHNIRLRKISN